MLFFKKKSRKDVLTQNAVRSELPLFMRNLLVQVFPEVDSTNLVAKAYASQGATHGTTIIADRQTAGRGRLGRSFESPDGGLYMTMIMRPQMRIDTATELTSIAGVVVCQALEELDPSLNPQIKWVNDIYLNEKKVCGILAESVTQANGVVDSIVIGIGVNVYTSASAFSPEVKKVASAVYPSLEDVPFTRAQLAARIIGKMMTYANKLGSHNHMSEYRQRCFTLRADVEFDYEGELIQGKVMDIRDDCSLLIELPDGRQRIISSGEVSLRMKKEEPKEEQGEEYTYYEYVEIDPEEEQEINE